MNTTIQQIQSQFEQGVDVARDPANKLALNQGGNAVTTLDSQWLYQRCPICAHTFRLGDHVKIFENHTVRHNSALLPCAKREEVKAENSSETEQFYQGLDQTWPPPKDLPIIRLEQGHKLLREPFAGFQRHRCVVCGHTLRPHDHVVICPCNPHDSWCETAIHRDPLHGLHCLEAWKPEANEQDHCPVTSRKLNG